MRKLYIYIYHSISTKIPVPFHDLNAFKAQNKRNILVEREREN